MADNVRTLRVELTAGIAGFQRGFAQAASSTQKLSSGLSGLRSTLSAGLATITGVVAPVAAAVTAVGGAFAAAAKHTMDYADAFVDLSTRSGHTVEWLQATKFAAEQSGLSLDQVTSASEKLRKSLGEGSEKTTAAVRALGLSFQELRAASPDEQVNRVLQALAGVDDATARTTIAMQLFGKSGGALLAMAGDFETLKARAEELGLVLSEKNVRAAEALGDGVDALRGVFGGLVNNMGVTVTSSSAVHEVLGILTSAFAELSRWVAANQEEIRGFISGGLSLLASYMSGVLSTIQLFVHGWFELQLAGVAVAANFERVAATFRMLKEVMANPLQAKAIFAEYNQELGRIAEAQRAASDSIVQKRASVDKAFAAGQGVIVKVTDALDRLGSAEVKVEGTSRKAAGGITEVGDAADKAAEQAAKAALKLEQEYNKALASIVDVGPDDSNLFADLARQVEETVPKLGLLGPAASEVTREFDELRTAMMFGSGGEGPAGLDDVQLKAFIAEMERLGDTGRLTSEQWSVLGDAYTEAMRRGIMATGEATAATTRFGDAVKASLAKLPEVILGAIQGGGDIGQAIGASLGGDIGTGLGKALEKSLKGVLGSTLAGALGSVLGPLGSLVGGALGKLVGNLFGGKEKEVNKLRDSFIESQGGLDALRRKAAEAGVSLDRLFAARDSKKGVQAAIDEITGKLGSWDAAQEAVNEAAERYGLTIEELGPKFAQQKLDEQAAQLLQDYRVLQASGADMNAVIAKMAPNFSTFVQQALAAGQAIPLAMKPMVDQLIQSGQLLDANGNAFTSAEAAGITFTETLTEGLSRAVDAIEALVAALTGVPPVTIPVNYQVGPRPGEPEAGPPPAYGGGADPRELPSFSTGGIGDFGRGSLAILHRREAIIPLDRGGAVGGLGTTINIAAPINENPLATWEGLQRQREFTVREIRRQVERNLPAAIAAGLA